ncbi:MAG: cadherin domain-containing protein, partial [Sphingopyxis sp.]|nr:cadherin domain-containing protein [Sphingopyxis sp.]
DAPRPGGRVHGRYAIGGPGATFAGQSAFRDCIPGNRGTIPFPSFVAGQTLPSSRLARRNEDFAPDAGTVGSIASFGEDSAGNLFIVSINGDIFMVRPG